MSKSQKSWNGTAGVDSETCSNMRRLTLKFVIQLIYDESSFNEKVLDLFIAIIYRCYIDAWHTVDMVNVLRLLKMWILPYAPSDCV